MLFSRALPLQICNIFISTIPVANRNGMGLLRSMSSSNISDYILKSESKRNGTLIINRPKVLNALNMQMIRQIDLTLREFENSKSKVIIKGCEKSFSVGGDIAALLRAGLADSITFFREVYTLLYFISNYKIPNIALIDGLTMGGGVGLAVHGRYSVATERTVLAMPETAIGLFPDVGSSYFLNRLEGKLGLFLGLTGHPLRGEDVARVGLTTHFCQSDNLSDLESELLKSSDPKEVPIILNKYSSQIAKEEGINLPMNRIKNCFNALTVEEIFQNLEKDGSDWALKILKTLKEKCPLSLKLTLKQMQEGANLGLDECLKMEFRMASRCLGNYNFYEGVRALLLDKDRKPAWNPPSIENVTNDYVSNFFERLPEGVELKL